MHFDGWTLALQVVNFAVLVWLLQRFLYKPTLRMIDQRKAQLDQRAAAAAALEATARTALAGIEAQREGIAAERNAALADAAAQAGEAARARREAAEREAQAIVAAARTTLAAERQAATTQLRRSALELGSAFAQRLLDEIPPLLRAQAWIELIEERLAALPEAERRALVDPLHDGDAITVTTAAPLTATTAQEWRGRLRRCLGADVAITFTTDPDLLAGAELHFPTAILRLSWQDTLRALRAEIDRHDDDDAR